MPTTVLQTLTLELDEITASDYLQWVRDPEPPALGGALRSVRVDAEPLGDTITAVLDWAGPAPRAHLAAPAAGLPLADGIRLRSGQERTEDRSDLERIAVVGDVCLVP